MGKREKVLEELRSSWGKRADRPREFAVCRDFSRLVPSREGEDQLDDQTWKDLLLDEVYARVDRTNSSVGELALYRLLRTPLLDPGQLRRRNDLISRFQKDAIFRERIQEEHCRLGRLVFPKGIVQLLGPFPLPEMSWLYSTSTAMALLALSMVWFWHPAFLVLVLLFVVNLGLQGKAVKETGYHLASIKYVAKSITAARRLASLKTPGIEAYQDRLQVLADATRPVVSSARWLTTGDLFPNAFDFVYEYFNVLFLIEVRTSFRVLGEIQSRAAQLKELILLVGELDALQSVASYRMEQGAAVVPEFLDGARSLEVRDTVHPLLERAVPNSLSADGRGVLITGSNMAGKSTFLRVLGLNAVLAQTICTCTGSSYRASIFRVRTSMSPADDLLQGKSLYAAEAEVLLNMIRLSQGRVPTLLLVDEPLRGTNSVERRAACLEIFRYLSAHHSSVVIATHDVELAALLGEHYSMFHFNEEVSGENYTFDYRLKPGIVKAGNALRLLAGLGYPQEIIDRALHQIGGT